MENLKSKKILIAIVTISIFIFLCALGLLSISDDFVNIKVSENSHVKYENFDNGLFSMKIPKGWTVKIQENIDYPYYTFMVYNPENTNYRIFVNLKYEGFLKSQSAKNFFIKYYGKNNVFAQMPVLAQPTTESYYKNTFSQVAKKNSTNSFVIPIMSNFTVIQNFGKTAYGGDLLRGVYTDNNGNKVEGLFTASPKDIGSYYTYENIMLMSGKRIDTYYRNVYDTMFITAPEGEFVNWEKALTTCLDSIKFSETFMNGFNKSQDKVMRNIQANSQVYNKISDMVMSSWEKRNSSYDIMSQKRSDVTLGYERVYDTEKGEVYKAYNGFTDDYKGKRFQPVTDDMYAKPIAGYIEK